MAAIDSPSSMAEVQHVVIGPIQRRISDEDHIYQIADPWEPIRVLRALQATPHIQSVTIDLYHINNHNQASDTLLSFGARADPVDVLELLYCSCHNEGLCTWHVDAFPKALITHFPTSKALSLCHPYRHDKAGWKRFVAANLDKPEIPAFDYTAEFHSKDLSGPEKGGADCGDAEFLDFLPLGSGYVYPYGGSDMDFATDMENNMLTYTQRPDRWMPDAYQRSMAEGGASSSVRI